jgi:hypothetical protein
VEKNLIFARHARINVYFCRKLPHWWVRKLIFISTMLGYTFVSLLCLRPRFAGSERVRRPTVDPTARAVVFVCLVLINASMNGCVDEYKANNNDDYEKPCVTTTIFFS